LTYSQNKRINQKERKQEEKSIGTLYPLEVLAAMKQLAETHGRSFNSEVIWALREYIRQQKEGR
jgi:hypothetical protein